MVEIEIGEEVAFPGGEIGKLVYRETRKAVSPEDEETLLEIRFYPEGELPPCFRVAKKHSLSRCECGRHRSTITDEGALEVYEIIL